MSESSESDEAYSGEDADHANHVKGDCGCKDHPVRHRSPQGKCEDEGHLKSVPEEKCDDEKPAPQCKEEQLKKVPEEKCEDDETPHQNKEQNLTTVPEDKCEDDHTVTTKAPEHTSTVKVTEAATTSTPVVTVSEPSSTAAATTSTPVVTVSEAASKAAAAKATGSSTIPNDGCDDDEQEVTTKVPTTTPSSGSLDQQANTPLLEPSTNATSVAQSPSTEPSTVPSTELPTTPETDSPTTPETEVPTTSETESPTTPPTDLPTTPETDAPTTPETEAPTTPATDLPTTPTTGPQGPPESDSLSGARTVPDGSSAPNASAPGSQAPPESDSLSGARTVVDASPSTVLVSTILTSTALPSTSAPPETTTAVPTTTPQATTLTPSTAAAIMTTLKASTIPPTTTTILTTTSEPLTKLTEKDCGTVRLASGQFKPIRENLTKVVGTLSDPSILIDQIDFLVIRIDKMSRSGQCEVNIKELLQDIWNVICQSWPLLQDVLQQAAQADSDLDAVLPIIDQLIELQNLQRKLVEALAPYVKDAGIQRAYDAVKYLSDKLSETLPKVRKAVKDGNRSLIGDYARFSQEVVNAIDAPARKN